MQVANSVTGVFPFESLLESLQQAISEYSIPEQQASIDDDLDLNWDDDDNDDIDESAHLLQPMDVCASFYRASASQTTVQYSSDNDDDDDDDDDDNDENRGHQYDHLFQVRADSSTYLGLTRSKRRRLDAEIIIDEDCDDWKSNDGVRTNLCTLSSQLCRLMQAAREHMESASEYNASSSSLSPPISGIENKKVPLNKVQSVEFCFN